MNKGVHSGRALAKRITALLTALLMVLGIMPLGKVAYAETVVSIPYVKAVTYSSIYSDGNNSKPSVRQLIVEGSGLKGVQITIVGTNNGVTVKQTSTAASNYEIIDIKGMDSINKVIVEEQTVEIAKETIPSISGIENRNIYVNKPESVLAINGSFLDKITKINEVTGEGYFMKFDESIEGTSTVSNDGDSMLIRNVKGELGSRNITIGMTKKHDDSRVDVTIENRYLNQFKLVKEISIDDIYMTPNKGQFGEEIEFTSLSNLSEYDVFLVRELSDTLTDKNKCTDRQYKSVEDSKNILTVKVPQKSDRIDSGEYYVVLTNRVEGTGSLESKITKQKNLTETFTIVNANQSMNIENASTKNGKLEGPDIGGTEVKLQGRYMGTLTGIEGLISAVPTLSINEKGALEVNYKLEGTPKYNSKKIEKIKREITVTIGLPADFIKEELNNALSYGFTTNNDTITVKTKGITADIQDLSKDITIETITTLTLEGSEIITLKEKDTYGEKFKYLSSKIKPTVKSITPGQIFVKTDESGNVEILEDTLISIEGSDFLTQTYKDPVTKELKTSYPVIKLGNGVVLDKNTNKDIWIRVLNSLGNIVDGSDSNQLGSKILIKVPAGKYVQKAEVADVEVTNPIKDTQDPGFSGILPGKLKFTEINSNSAPKIDSVDPDVVTLEGGQTITIKGSNFNGDVIVLIDGKKVDNITRQPDGKQITFLAPAGREGETQLQVINPGIGIAIKAFRYVKAYTDPKITSILPNKGTKGTHVVIKGQNFLEPNAATYTGENGDILKLLGSRVKLGDKDVNEYNINKSGKIELKGLNAKEEILTAPKAGGLNIADYYNSIILQDKKTDKWYTFDVSPKDGIILSSGSEIYMLSADSSQKIKAAKNSGEVYRVELSSEEVEGETFDSIILSDDKADGDVIMELVLYTPYKADNGKITGNNVKVRVDGDIYEIHLTIPDLGVSGKFDVTVVNPDTKGFTVKEGFEYIAQAESKPNITSITPDKGNVDGGYIITIEGKKDGDKDCFVSYATGGKTRVIINGVESKDVQIVTPEKITAVVPPLGFDLLKKYGVGRFKVPVTVLNPDGSSDTEENGFEYVIPSSKPKIAKLNPAQGSASGGDKVEIYGEGFSTSENPKIYFGANEATLQGSASSGYIVVQTPAATGGAKSVDVYVINSDTGISNKVKFTYTVSKPTITSVTPNVGNKAGGEEISISGNDFKAGNINIYGGNQKPVPLVRFGEISNKSLDKFAENSGRLEGMIATVNLPGGLKAEYNGNTKKVTLGVSINNVQYSCTINYDYDKDGVIYVPLETLKSGGSKLQTNELVRLEVADGRLLVERGYANGAQLLGSQEITVKTVPYHTIGKVGVFVINPDGGAAKGDFEYKSPSSKPAIVNIQKDSKDPEAISGERIIKATYKGGSAIKIIGQDFRENATIKIGNLAELGVGQISYSLPGELSFKMPAVPESEVGKKIEVFVENADGGIASSKKSTPPIYIIFTKGESAPQIESITPARGPSRGGEEAVIKGTDFRAGLSVIFGGKTVEPANITLIDYKTIKVKTPAHPSGTVDVSVENPDGERATLSGGYTYISSPAISKLYDADGKAEIKSISINGGQKITVKGSDFQSGARVVFMVEIEAAFGEGDIYIGSKTYKLKSSVEAAGVEFIDENTLRVTTPEGKLKGSGIMVINPDKGASDIFAGANYGLEKPAPPEGVTAELIYDDKAIRITWKAVEGAREYEIYESEDGSAYELAFSTKGTSYVYQGVEPRTSYRFKVRAIGKIATSDSSKESKEVTTGSKAGYQDTDGKLSENTSASMSGDRASVTIGTSSYKNGMTIDLTSGSLAGAKAVTISMPSAVVKASSAGEIRVIGRDFAVQFSPYAFRDALGGADELSGIKLTISPAYSSSEPGNTALSGEYKIEATAYEKGTERAIYTAGSPIYITLDFDRQKIQMRRLSNIFISWRDPSSSIWEKQGEITATYDSAVAARVYKLGSYRVTGSK